MNSEIILSRFIDNENFYLATSYLKGINPYYHQQQNIYYIRLIGDRELQKFNLIQRNQREILSSLKVKIPNFFEKKPIREIFIIVNNHFTGFAPETANHLKKMFHLTHRDFKSQKSLVDFM
ncbi:MAG: hypothetical protein BAJALOKI2v1_80054 [Promethearchaeota archaeon]|nr:MAG: hypothetical protein BAJALOKI2v1_80054 [Candidatus Lokiarchaeota archaeon]